MHFVSFIVVFGFIIIAIILFGMGLVRLHRKAPARGLISSGFVLGLTGVVISVILYGFFNL